MFSLTINVPADVLAAGQGTVQAAMYGQLLAQYTPQSGPSQGTPLAVNQWVYFTGDDYAAASGVTVVPYFASYTTAGAQAVALPDVFVGAAHVVFGIGTLPQIPVSSGAPQQPDPIATTTIYDFVEFTYNTAGVLYINTSSIDQFGIPIQIQVDPPAQNLPAGAGVTLDRTSVMGQFATYAAGANAAFAQCAQDAFGSPLTTRILSPQNALVASAVQGVAASVFTGPPSTLAAGQYYYVVTALNAQSQESVAHPNVVPAWVMFAGQAVQVAWAPNASQPAGTVSYNVYRGTPSPGTVTWGLIGNVAASTFAAGGAYADTGQATTAQSPPLNPLATWFDTQIQDFFAAYVNASTPLTLTAMDGTDDGYLYTFSGVTGTDAAGNPCLVLTVQSVSGTSSPPIPLGTPFYIYYPYWSTNTWDVTNPPPPTFELYDRTPASMMVFAAEGVFADNAQQVPAQCATCAPAEAPLCCVNLPPQVSQANSGLYGTLLGALENQIVAALTRGIANAATPTPQNWAVPPVQLQPAATGTGSLSGTWYYVITAVNANGETTASFEFSVTPQNQSVQLSWLPVGTEPATSFNIYRGTASQQENILAGSAPAGGTNTWTDDGSGTTQQSPPSFFPPGVPWSAYDAFFHQPAVSLNGAAYAGPYDDQGGQSSTLAAANPTSATITLGPWGS